MIGADTCRRVFGLCTAIGVACIGSLAVAAAPEPSAEDFVREPATDWVRFSPDGSRFAARAERQGQLVLVVVDFATNKGRVFSSDRGSDLDSFRWLTDDLIVVRTTKMGVRAFDLSRNDFEPAYVSVDGKSRIDPSVAARTFRRVPGTKADIIVARPWREDYGSQELDLYDAQSGQLKRKITGEPPGPMIRRWVLNRDLVPIAALGYDIRTRRSQVWWRDREGSAWQLALSYDQESERGFHPVAVDVDGELLVLSNVDTGRYALHRFDKRTGKPGELLIGHPRYDIAPRDLIYEAREHHPVGVAVNADRWRYYWFDERRDAIQRLIDKSLPEGSVNRLQFLADGKVLVHSMRDIERGAYFFYDPDSRSISEWSRAMPWLDPARLSRMQVVDYRASDGLELQGYLTVPRASSTGKPPPLLVWVHGGPNARDEWGFNPFVQFMASRGYAVFQPNFRGSTGFGIEFTNAGDRQWGARMPEDIADGVRTLIEAGRVDPARICIGGASYGGYAALMGLIRHPTLYRCAIDMLGPTDLIRLLRDGQSDTNRRRGDYMDREIEGWLRTRIGDPEDPEGRRMLELQSPSRHATQIKAPVLLIYGTDDPRVPLEQGTIMRDALAAANRAFEWKSYAGEGHGIWDRKNHVDWMLRVERFLSGSLAGTSAPQ